jgi:hypothetical protein
MKFDRIRQQKPKEALKKSSWRLKRNFCSLNGTLNFLRATVSLLTAQVAIVQPSMHRRVIDALSRQQLVLFENNLALEKSSAPAAEQQTLKLTLLAVLWLALVTCINS